ncbi:Olfactory receptor 11G2 [Heterocephalus glaber]|uniref:Olfactory receptor 11G2 n=1 Tax=Heterocephalus glaber TaxID=10181 RepID=G5C1X7_HETGA|nr:Olfactory receptor 11G2 [Heterocephalus glaber]
MAVLSGGSSEEQGQALFNRDWSSRLVPARQPLRLQTLPFPRREIQVLLTVVFSFIYLLTLTGNTSIIWAVWSSPKLHRPMCSLLANFSFLEICYISSDVPKMLDNLISQTKSILYVGCLLQFYFFFSMCAAECLFLPMMSFD